MTPLPCSPAADNNKQPILEVLRSALPARGNALEIASGTGQHVAWFAAALSGWRWQPTDADRDNLSAIAAWSAASGAANIQAPLWLDVMAAQWLATGRPSTLPFDAIYCANMLHIAPWAATAALMQGCGRHLAQDGLLILYGPYLEDAVPTAPGNVAFDLDLRRRDPAWGIRRLEDVVAQAETAGMGLQARHPMPANNLLLFFRRSA